jgi:hypothetical protein
VEQLCRRYEQRLGGGAYLGALMAGLENIHTGNAELYYVHPQGYGEAAPYRCSGHGADYAHALAKFLLLPELSVEESAFRAAFIIWWVEDLDTTVGGPPQVAMIRNRPSVPLSGQAVATVEYLIPESAATTVRPLPEYSPQPLRTTNRPLCSLGECAPRTPWTSRSPPLPTRQHLHHLALPGQIP